MYFKNWLIHSLITKFGFLITQLLWSILTTFSTSNVYVLSCRCFNRCKLLLLRCVNQIVAHLESNEHNIPNQQHISRVLCQVHPQQGGNHSVFNKLGAFLWENICFHELCIALFVLLQAAVQHPLYYRVLICLSSLTLSATIAGEPTSMLLSWSVCMMATRDPAV